MAGPKIARIDQSNLREDVYSALSSAFTRGEFAPGDTVNLRSLADQLGTSMTPVREAVRRLVAEGALIDTPSRTLAVPAFDKSRMTDLKRARLALEPLIVDQAMDNLGSADIDELQAILDKPGGNVPGKPDLARNYSFHFSLYRKSRSQVLLPIIEGLWLQYGAYLNLVVNHPGAKIVDENTYHRIIIAGLRRNDRKAVREALVSDIERSFDIIF